MIGDCNVNISTGIHSTWNNRQLKGGKCAWASVAASHTCRFRASVGEPWTCQIARTRLDFATGAHRPHADVRRGRLEVLQECVDIDVSQVPELVGIQLQAQRAIAFLGLTVGSGNRGLPARQGDRVRRALRSATLRIRSKRQRSGERVACRRLSMFFERISGIDLTGTDLATLIVVDLSTASIHSLDGHDRCDAVLKSCFDRRVGRFATADTL